jgi:DNA-directed RNA polymerase specialized sigma24 family protein
MSLLSASDPGHLPDTTIGVDHRDQVVRLLLQLPAGQRTAIVLRYLEDMTEAETADAMGCSVGAVKSATSRGLQRLRQLSGFSLVLQNTQTGGQA